MIVKGLNPFWDSLELQSYKKNIRASKRNPF